MWNYFDIGPSIVNIIICGNDLIGQRFPRYVESTLNATAALMLWFKMLYFLRVFPGTGFYIRMITEVIIDMKHFFGILLICIIGFSDAFYSLSIGNDEADRFIHTPIDAILFTYRMILGDFDSSAFGSVAMEMVWLLFIFCTLFNMIIMLNLLIAIISESYAKIFSNSSKAAY